VTDSEREELFGKVSDKWIWTLLGVFVCVSIINVSVDAGWIIILAFILNTLFWWLDVGELKAKGYSGGWVLSGLLVPVYLFVRAVKTNKKYVCAIIYYEIYNKESIDDNIQISAQIITRAVSLNLMKLGKMDSFHLAAAEAAGADFLITTDERFIRKSKNRNITAVKIIDPLDF
jgi:hypothetical protein